MGGEVYASSKGESSGSYWTRGGLQTTNDSNVGATCGGEGGKQQSDDAIRRAGEKGISKTGGSGIVSNYLTQRKKVRKEKKPGRGVITGKKGKGEGSEVLR